MMASGMGDEDACSMACDWRDMETTASMPAPLAARLVPTISSERLWGLGSPTLSSTGRSAVQDGADMLRHFDAGADTSSTTVSPDTRGQKLQGREGQRAETPGGLQGSTAAAFLEVVSGSSEGQQSAQQVRVSGRDSSGSSSDGSGASGTSNTSKLAGVAALESGKAGTTMSITSSSLVAGLGVDTAGTAMPTSDDVVCSPTGSWSASAAFERGPESATTGARGGGFAPGSNTHSPNALNNHAAAGLIAGQTAPKLANKTRIAMPHSHASVSSAATAAHERDMASAVRELLLPIVASMDLRTIGVAVIEGIVERYSLLPMPQLLNLYKWQLNNGLLLPRQSGGSGTFSATTEFPVGMNSVTAAGQDSTSHAASSPMLGAGLGGSGMMFGAATTSVAAAADPSIGPAHVALPGGTRAAMLEPHQQRLTYAPHTSPTSLRSQPPLHPGQATELRSTSTHAGRFPQRGDVMGNPLHLPPLAGQLHHHSSSRYQFAADRSDLPDNMRSPRASVSWTSGAHGAAGGDMFAPDVDASGVPKQLPCPVQHPLLLPVLGSRMVSKAGPGGLSVVITNQSSPHQAARSAYPLSSGRHTFNFKVSQIDLCRGVNLQRNHCVGF